MASFVRGIPTYLGKFVGRTHYYTTNSPTNRLVNGAADDYTQPEGTRFIADGIVPVAAEFNRAYVALGTQLDLLSTRLAVPAITLAPMSINYNTTQGSTATDITALSGGLFFIGTWQTPVFTNSIKVGNLSCTDSAIADADRTLPDFTGISLDRTTITRYAITVSTTDDNAQYLYPGEIMLFHNATAGLSSLEGYYLITWVAWDATNSVATIGIGPMLDLQTADTKTAADLLSAIHNSLNTLSDTPFTYLNVEALSATDSIQVDILASFFSGDLNLLTLTLNNSAVATTTTPLAGRFIGWRTFWYDQSEFDPASYTIIPPWDVQSAFADPVNYDYNLPASVKLPINSIPADNTMQSVFEVQQDVVDHSHGVAPLVATGGYTDAVTHSNCTLNSYLPPQAIVLLGDTDFDNEIPDVIGCYVQLRDSNSNLLLDGIITNFTSSTAAKDGVAKFVVDVAEAYQDISASVSGVEVKYWNVIHVTSDSAVLTGLSVQRAYAKYLIATDVSEKSQDILLPGTLWKLTQNAITPTLYIPYHSLGQRQISAYTLYFRFDQAIGDGGSIRVQPIVNSYDFLGIFVYDGNYYGMALWADESGNKTFEGIDLAYDNSNPGVWTAPSTSSDNAQFTYGDSTTLSDLHAALTDASKGNLTLIDQIYDGSAVLNSALAQATKTITRHAYYTWNTFIPASATFSVERQLTISSPTAGIMLDPRSSVSVDASTNLATGSFEAAVLVTVSDYRFGRYAFEEMVTALGQIVAK